MIFFELYHFLVEGVTPLYKAVQNGHFSVVATLLRPRITTNASNSASTVTLSGARPSPRAHDGLTPLMIAALKSYTEIAIALLDAGALIDCAGTLQNTNANSGLGGKLTDKAATSNNLTPNKANGGVMAMTDANGAVSAAPTHVAANIGAAANASALGAAPTSASALLTVAVPLALAPAPAPAGARTLLHIAAMRRNGVLCRALLLRGADPRARDAQGRRPADVARLAGDLALGAELEAAAVAVAVATGSAGASISTPVPSTGGNTSYGNASLVAIATAGNDAQSRSASATPVNDDSKGSLMVGVKKMRMA